MNSSDFIQEHIQNEIAGIKQEGYSVHNVLTHPCACIAFEDGVDGITLKVLIGRQMKCFLHSKLEMQVS